MGCCSSGNIEYNMLFVGLDNAGKTSVIKRFLNKEGVLGFFFYIYWNITSFSL
jgi:AAA+ ATPase superfamily predicted ATPase